jgi:hypothetical protein
MTEMSLESWLATTASSAPSAFRSPMATATGPSPAGSEPCDWKPPLPMPLRKVTVASLLLATSRSALLSPSMSPTADANGLRPVG